MILLVGKTLLVGLQKMASKITKKNYNNFSSSGNSQLTQCIQTLLSITSYGLCQSLLEMQVALKVFYQNFMEIARSHEQRPVSNNFIRNKFSFYSSFIFEGVFWFVSARKLKVRLLRYMSKKKRLSNYFHFDQLLDTKLNGRDNLPLWLFRPVAIRAQWAMVRSKCSKNKIKD